MTAIHTHPFFGQNRKARRTANAIARRDPTNANLEANELAQKAPQMVPFIKPKKVAA